MAAQRTSRFWFGLIGAGSGDPVRLPQPLALRATRRRLASLSQGSAAPLKAGRRECNRAGRTGPRRSALFRCRLSASPLGTVTAIEAIVRQNDRQAVERSPPEAAGRCCCLTSEAVVRPPWWLRAETGSLSGDWTVGVRRHDASAWPLRGRCSRAGPAVGDECDPQWRARRAEQNAGRRRRHADLATTQVHPGGGRPGPCGATPKCERPPCTNPRLRKRRRRDLPLRPAEARSVSWCWRSRRGPEIGPFGSCTKPHILTQGFWTNCRYRWQGA